MACTGALLDSRHLLDKLTRYKTVSAVWPRRRKIPQYLHGNEPWQRKTRNLLANGQFRGLGYLAPFTSLSHDVPNSHIEPWYASIMEVAGYVTNRKDDTGSVSYYPGVGFTPQLVAHLLLKRHAPLGFLKHVPWGVFAVALEKAGTAKATNRGLLWQYAEDEFGVGGSAYLREVTPQNLHMRAPWPVTMCHHNAHHCLTLAANFTPTQLKTLALLSDRFELDASTKGSCTAAQEYQSSYSVDLGCVAQYPDRRTNLAVAPTLATMRARPRWVPCPPSVVSSVSQLGSQPVHVVTAQLWVTSLQPLSTVRGVAEAAAQ